MTRCSARPTAAWCWPGWWGGEPGRALAPPAARPHRRRGRAHPRAARPRPDRPRAGHVQPHVERALLLQAQQAAAAGVSHDGRSRAPGPGRERRRGGRGRRDGGGAEDREPQPPLGRGALRGRGHRGGRHRARHPGDGRAADRPSRLPALRRALERAQPPPVHPLGGGHRALRQLHRRADRGRRGVVRRPLRGVVPGQRDVRGDRGSPPGAAGGGLGPGQRRSC